MVRNQKKPERRFYVKLIRQWIINCLLSFLVWFLIMPDVVWSQETHLPIVPSPSITDFTRGEGWGIAIGIGLEYESAYDGSDEYELEIEPAGAVQWRKDNHMFFWEGIELGWRSRIADCWLLQVAGRYESGREEDDSDDGRLDGLEDQDDELVGVFEMRRAFDSEWRNWIGGRIMAGRSEFGLLGILAAGHRFGSQLDGTGTEIFVFATFGNSNFINRDFGISSSESVTSGYPETDLSGGYRSTGISLVDRRYLTRHIHLITKAGFEYYSNDIQDSPIAREDFEAEAGIALVYHF
jgi:outer membrane scaffolding protein for murein synthesis (MipA/OmpV family)